MSKNVNLICKNCRIEFNYPQKEFNRQVKKGRINTDFACSRSCSTSWRNKNTQYNVTESRKNHLLSKGEKRKRGNFTWYLNKARNRKHETNLTEEYLQELWNKQNGKCSITSYNMSMYSRSTKNTPYTASLDRIDSSIGNIKDNVQFVCYSVNLAKQSFDNEVMLEFFNR